MVRTQTTARAGRERGYWLLSRSHHDRAAVSNIERALSFTSLPLTVLDSSRSACMPVRSMRLRHVQHLLESSPMIRSRSRILLHVGTCAVLHASDATQASSRIDIGRWSRAPIRVRCAMTAREKKVRPKRPVAQYPRRRSRR